MLDSEAPSRRHGPGRHRRPLTRRRAAIMVTLVRAMNALLAKVRREH